MTELRILAAGMTGLLGKSLLPLLIRDARIGRIDVVIHQTPLSAEMLSDKVRCISISSLETMEVAPVECSYDVALCLSGNSYSQTSSERVMREANLAMPRLMTKFCVKNHVKHLVLASSINARLAGCMGYARYKRESEVYVVDSGVPYTIFRPALLFGTGDAGFSKLTAYINHHYLIPVFGDGNKLEQPMPVEECAAFFHQATVLPPANAMFEIGGHDAMTYNDMLFIMARVLGRTIRLVHIPSKPLFFMLRTMERMGLGVPTMNSEQIAHIDSDLDIDNRPAIECYGVTLSPFEERFRSYIAIESAIIAGDDRKGIGA